MLRCQTHTQKEEEYRVYCRFGYITACMCKIYKRPVVLEPGLKMCMLAYGALWWFMCGQFSLDVKDTNALLGGGGVGLRDFNSNGPRFIWRFGYYAVVSEEAGEAQPCMQNVGLVRQKKKRAQPVKETMEHVVRMGAIRGMTGGDRKAAIWENENDFPPVNLIIDQDVFSRVCEVVRVLPARPLSYPPARWVVHAVRVSCIYAPYTERQKSQRNGNDITDGGFINQMS